MVIFVLFIT